MEGGMESKGERKVDHFIFLKLFSPLDLHLIFCYQYVAHYIHKLQKYKNIPEPETNLPS